MRAMARLLLIGALAGAVGCDEAEPYPRPDGQLDPYAQAAALGKGVNLGNLLDAPTEGDWTDGQVLQASDFDLAKAAGFDSVRIPVRFSAHAGRSRPYTIDPEFMARVDQVVGWGLERGLRVVVDVHHYEEIHKDPAAHAARFVALWSQIARHFKDAPDGLYFELLNEPHGELTAAVWNPLVEKTLRAIRAIDPHHTVVVAGVDWSNFAGLTDLVIPAEETNAIVTFHYYTPHLFTFQGKTEFMGPDWATTGITWPGPPEAPITAAPGVGQWVLDWILAYNILDGASNPAGEAAVWNEIYSASEWGSYNHRPLWMSEFTAQDGAPLASRARWLAYVRTQLEERGIPWSMWTLDSDKGARLYDPGTGLWTLELTQALGLDVSND